MHFSLKTKQEQALLTKLHAGQWNWHVTGILNYSERHVTVLICLQETCQALFESHYMYARAKFTKNNKQSINWAWSQMTEETTGFPNCHRV